MKRVYLIIIICIAAGLLIGGYFGVNGYLFSKVTTKNRIYTCINSYIEEIKSEESYKSAYKDLQNSAFNDSIDGFEINKSIERYKIDSMILFNKTKDSCCGFILQICTQQDGLGCDEHVIEFNGIQNEDKWHFRRGFTTSFKSKAHLSFSHLSQSTRIDMALDGFIKNNNCEVDWDYIRKWFEN